MFDLAILQGCFRSAWGQDGWHGGGGDGPTKQRWVITFKKISHFILLQIQILILLRQKLFLKCKWCKFFSSSFCLKLTIFINNLSISQVNVYPLYLICSKLTLSFKTFFTENDADSQHCLQADSYSNCFKFLLFYLQNKTRVADLDQNFYKQK